MDISELINALDTEKRRELGALKDVSELAQAAKKFGLNLTEDETAVLFAALYPFREKTLTDEEIASVSGGAAPKPSVIPGNNGKKKTIYL